MRSKRQRESGLLCCIVDSASGILGKDHDQAEVHENACHIEHIPYNHAVVTWVRLEGSCSRECVVHVFRMWLFKVDGQ